MTRPFLKAFACAGILFLVLLAALFLGEGTPASSDGATEAAARLALMVIVPAAIAGLMRSG
jgi:hypothetical protein